MKLRVKLEAWVLVAAAGTVFAMGSMPSARFVSDNFEVGILLETNHSTQSRSSS